MTDRLTDKRAIQIALNIAIDTEDAMIDAYGDDKTAAGAVQARKNIDAFKRVLTKYYGGPKKDPLLASGAKRINIFSLFKD